MSHCLNQPAKLEMFYVVKENQQKSRGLTEVKRDLNSWALWYWCEYTGSGKESEKTNEWAKNKEIKKQKETNEEKSKRTNELTNERLRKRLHGKQIREWD